MRRAISKEIFRSNIALEHPSRLSEPASSNLTARFFGSAHLMLRHPFTGDNEDIEEYIWRHTLGRPRDFMIIGERIANLRVQERDRINIRKTVNEAARDIGRFYIGEIYPHLEAFDKTRLFQKLKKNIMSASEIREIADAYNREVHGVTVELNNAAYRHIFCDLYHAELLGVVGPEFPDGTVKQLFQPVADTGETIFHSSPVLPSSEYYLLHPVLGSYVQEYAPDFVRHIDTRNIVSPGAAWRTDNGLRFVLKADVVNYSSIMGDPGLSHAFPSFFKKVVQDATPYIRYSAIPAGDDVVIVDHNPYHIISAMRSITVALANSYFGSSVRFGLSYELVRFQSNETPQTGSPLRYAARLEPRAKPGTVLMAAPAREALLSFDPSLKIVEITEDDKYDMRRTSHGWYIGKRQGRGEKGLFFDRLFVMVLEVQ